MVTPVMVKIQTVIMLTTILKYVFVLRMSFFFMQETLSELLKKLSVKSHFHVNVHHQLEHCIEHT